jgi:hypothetical protein
MPTQPADRLEATPGPWTVGEIDTAWHEGSNLPPEIGLTVNGSHWNKVVASVMVSDANARLIARAPDHALIVWAMCIQDGRWIEWAMGKGEFCFCGICYVTSLDEFGCPVLTPALRAAITKARGQ